MKYFVSIILLLVLLVFAWKHRKQPKEQNDSNHPELFETLSIDVVDASIERVQTLISGMLVAMKEPYRPPMGDNHDISRALLGHNRYGDVWMNPDDSLLNEKGLLVDPWGSPYHFHPRSSDAIDIRSAGPDRILFTTDDITSP